VTSKVEIQVEEIDDVLQVPIHAVFPEESQHFCFVFADGGVERRVVEVGKNNAHHVEVTSGLEEGERVLLYDPRLDGEVETKESGGGDEDLGLSSDLAGMGSDT
jgi:hypothetical protein